MPGTRAAGETFAPSDIAFTSPTEGVAATTQNRLYRTTDGRRARELIDRYGVDYVFVGRLERLDYPADGLAKFARLGREAFRSGETAVYEVSRGTSR